MDFLRQNYLNKLNRIAIQRMKVLENFGDRNLFANEKSRLNGIKNEEFGVGKQTILKENCR